MNLKDVAKAVIEKYGKTMQTVIAIEEMSELTKELTKAIRGSENHDAIVEEVADVYIVLHEIQIMYDINLNEVFKEMEFKTERMKERLEEDESV